MKRRELTGEYETDWQEIPSQFVKSYGSLSYNLDNLLPSFFKQNELTIDLVNVDGFFSKTTELKSFFRDKLTISQTLVKIDAGYVDEYGVEYNVNPTVYLGMITGEITYNDSSAISFTTKNYQTIFDYPVSKIGLSGGMTASEVVEAIRDYVDGNAVKIFQKYIPEAAWHIETTTSEYDFNVVTSQNDKLSCWQLMSKLAGSERKILSVNGKGQLSFSEVNIDLDIDYYFTGVNELRVNNNPVNIGNDFKISDNIEEVYNRISVKFSNSDTTTSYKIYDIDYDWGDSESGFYYGTKELSYTNNFMATATAETISRNLFIEYEWPKRKVEFSTIFVPQLNLQDKINVTYATKLYDDDSTKWGGFLWGVGKWTGRQGYNIKVDDKNFIIKRISHNLNNFKSKITARQEDR